MSTGFRTRSTTANNRRLSAGLLCLPILLSIGRTAFAQEINLYSEFLRFNPFGQIVAQDREVSPREILSPAVPRKGHVSVQLVVTAPANTNYFLYISQNPHFPESA